ncbi:hypothetical protein DSO57_1001224 [Entomophthora muscae]|uniref:Uncharacterized protein n=1 Tax=Entomophthora muscae TaxID=34485 RepID=A0ACC2SLS7_9FUNG|nr:hypothetical protein DSO57_1001224 [Entomophthora muscae]
MSCSHSPKFGVALEVRPSSDWGLAGHGDFQDPFGIPSYSQRPVHAGINRSHSSGTADELFLEKRGMKRNFSSGHSPQV